MKPIGRPVVAGALVALTTLVVFLPVLRCGFVSWDDPQGVPRYAIVTHGLSWSGVRWAFAETDYFANWVPLTVLSHMVDFELYGRNPAGHHLTSLVLHALTAVLLFAFWQLATGRTGAAASIALLWALHPLRVECVAWLASRTHLLAACLAMLTLVLYVSWVGKRSWPRYVAALLAFAAALLAKSMVITLPLVLLLVDVWPLRRLEATERRAADSVLSLVVEKVPFVVVASAVAAVALVGQVRWSAAGAGAHAGWLRIALAILAPVRYLAAMLWPANLSPLYPVPASAPAVGLVVAAAALLLAVTVGALAMRRRAPWSIVGWLWFLIALLPVSGIVQIGGQERADRYTYLPAMGIVAMVVWSVASLVRRSRWMPPLLVGLACLACTVGTRRQIAHWRSSEALFAYAVAVNPADGLAQLKLADALAVDGHLERAIDHYRLATAYRADLPYAWTGLGQALVRRSDRAGAEAAFDRAIALRPDMPSPHYELARLYASDGKVGPAVGHLAVVIGTPDGAAFTPAWQVLAALLRTPEARRTALPYVEAVARSKPDAPRLQQLAAWLRAHQS